MSWHVDTNTLGEAGEFGYQRMGLPTYRESVLWSPLNNCQRQAVLAQDNRLPVESSLCLRRTCEFKPIALWSPLIWSRFLVLTLKNYHFSSLNPTEKIKPRKYGVSVLTKRSHTMSKSLVAANKWVNNINT